MRYVAEVITRDLGNGPVKCIRCKCEFGTLIGYFDTVEELGRRVDLSLVDLIEPTAM